MKRKLVENWKRIEQRVADACAKSHRDPQSVTIVVVTKYVGLDLIRTLVEIGIQNFGESHVQELTRRAAMIKEWLGKRSAAIPDQPSHPQWHMIGHLQRNKVRALLPFVDLIHSVDSLRLAEELDAQSEKIGRVTPILLEVNATGESAKTGVAVAATTHLAEQIMTLKHLELRGLMAMGPLTEERDRIRQVFSRVRELFDEIIHDRICGPTFRELSLGMSNDFDLGIEFGATYVRIGSAIFEGIPTTPEPVEAE